MSRLTNPETGVTVSVDDDYGKQLQSEGWKAAGSESKAPAKKAASSSKNDSK